MDSVFAVIRASERKKHWFDELVSIFSSDIAYTELVVSLNRGVSNDAQVAPSTVQPAPTTAFAYPATPIEPVSVHSLLPVPHDQPPPSPHHPSTPSFWSLEKVKATIDDLEKMFANLHAKAGKELNEKESEGEEFLEDYRSHLLLLPVRKATLHVKVFNANEDEILAAKGTRKSLAILCRFVDYRNYEILYYIVLKFCDAPLQNRMQIFRKMLQEFETATTVDVYLTAIPDEVDEELKNGFSEMVVKIDKPESQCTLHEIRKLNKAIIQKSTLCAHSVYIHWSSVQERCSC